MSEEQKENQSDVNEQNTALSDEQLNEAAGGLAGHEKWIELQSAQMAGHEKWIELESVQLGTSRDVSDAQATLATDDPEINTRG